MQPLIDHLRERAARPRIDLGDPGASARQARRADAAVSLAELLEQDPALVRPPTRATIAAFVHSPASSLDDVEILGPRATMLVAGYGEQGEATSVMHLRLLDALAIAVVRDAWDMAAEVGDVLIRGGTTLEELATVVGLDVWEIEAALAGRTPGDDYFARRPELTGAERRTWIDRLDTRVGVDAWA